MGFRSRFVAGLAWRAAAFLGTVLLLALALDAPGLGAARILAVLLCLWSLYELWRHIRRTNVEVARFVEAVRLGDLSQSFSHGAEGSGFGEIGRALDGAIRALREERHRLSDAGRFYEAVLDDAPTPLLTIGNDGRVELTNKAARRLFVRHQGVRIEDFRDYGGAFAALLAEEA